MCSAIQVGFYQGMRLTNDPILKRNRQKYFMIHGNER